MLQILLIGNDLDRISTSTFVCTNIGSSTGGHDQGLIRKRARLGLGVRQSFFSQRVVRARRGLCVRQSVCSQIVVNVQNAPSISGVLQEKRRQDAGIQESECHRQNKFKHPFSINTNSSTKRHDQKLIKSQQGQALEYVSPSLVRQWLVQGYFQVYVSPSLVS